MIPVPNHRAFALGLFRTSVFFVFAVGAFAERDPHTRTILAMLVFLLDAGSWHLCEVVAATGNSVYNRVWHNTLADRIFLERVLDGVRAGASIDTDYIRKDSIKAASEDIGKYLGDETVWYHWSGFQKSMLGIGQFTWFWVSYGIFYGIAMFLGEMLRF